MLPASAFGLEQGAYRFEYSGAAQEVWVLWLPADGVPWQPRPELQESFREVFLYTEPPPLGE